MSRLRLTQCWQKVTLASLSLVAWRYGLLCWLSIISHANFQPPASVVHEESARIEAVFRKYCALLLLLPLSTLGLLSLQLLLHHLQTKSNNFFTCSSNIFTSSCKRATDYKAETAKADSSPDNAAISALDDDADPSEAYIIMVCHQNVIRYFACRALQLPPEAWQRFGGNNCGVTEIIVSDDGRVSLDKFADVGHLPLHMHTFH